MRRDELLRVARLPWKPTLNDGTSLPKVTMTGHTAFGLSECGRNAGRINRWRSPTD